MIRALLGKAMRLGLHARAAWRDGDCRTRLAILWDAARHLAASEQPRKERTMRIYKLDDGHVRHWVHAEDEGDALRLLDHHLRDECNLDDEEIPTAGDLEVTLIDVAKAAQTTFWEDHRPAGSLWGEYLRDPSRRYVACSEW
ncbi:MAG: hypothetical protein VYE22_09685 [Myxococcota bacterium]|nr:hypothetical protein [Myxococcota bacterium]